MEDEKFSQGPWRYEAETRTHMSSIKSPRGFVCIGLGGMAKKMSDADLALTLAATELYYALKEACLQHISSNGTKPPVEWINALKKARGEA